MTGGCEREVVVAGRLVVVVAGFVKNHTNRSEPCGGCGGADV